MYPGGDASDGARSNYLTLPLTNVYPGGGASDGARRVAGRRRAPPLAGHAGRECHAGVPRERGGSQSDLVGVIGTTRLVMLLIIVPYNLMSKI